MTECGYIIPAGSEGSRRSSRAPGRGHTQWKQSSLMSRIGFAGDGSDRLLSTWTYCGVTTVRDATHGAMVGKTRTQIPTAATKTWQELPETGMSVEQAARRVTVVTLTLNLGLETVPWVALLTCCSPHLHHHSDLGGRDVD